jgi:radical SAM protein with 4Fe4S-binding SPASM domain
MPVSIFDDTLDRYVCTELDQVRLLGGEPSLHPEFVGLVTRILDRGLRLLVFTNGQVSNSIMEFIASLSPEIVAILVNVTAIDRDDPPRVAQLSLVLEAWGQRARLGYTIQHAGMPLELLFGLVEKYALQPVVRLGLAHPCLGAETRFLATSRYPQIGVAIAEWAYRANTRGLRFELDCGFVPCMFPAGFLDAGLLAREDVGRQCGPIPDVLPDGTAIPCLPLARVTSDHLLKFRDFASLRAKQVRMLETYRQVGIYAECADCDWKSRGECVGGCLAQAMTRLRPSHHFLLQPANSCRIEDGTLDATVRTPTAHQQQGRWIIPYVSQDLAFWQAVADDVGQAVGEVYLPVYGTPASRERTRLASSDRGALIGNVPFALSALVVSEIGPPSGGNIWADVVEELRWLDGEHGLVGVTVTNLELATWIRDQMPRLAITGCFPIDVEHLANPQLLNDCCDAIVVPGHILRDLSALMAIRTTFGGKIRLLLNRGCIQGCPDFDHRFHELANDPHTPRSNCVALKRQHVSRQDPPACYVLPQELAGYDGRYDMLMLGPQMALVPPTNYLHLIRTYVYRQRLDPSELEDIGRDHTPTD